MQRRACWLAVALLAGCTLILLSLGGGLLALLSFFAGGGALAVEEVLQPAAAIALGLGLGIPLVLHGWAGWEGRPSRPFSPVRFWWLWLLLLLSIALGAVVSLVPLLPTLLLPPLHVVAMALPPSILLCLLGRAQRGKGGTWRDAVAGLGGGGFLGIGLSMVFELALLFVGIVFVVVVAMLTPGGPERIMELSEEIQRAVEQEDLAAVLPFLLSPVVILSTLVSLSVVVPFLEEVFKSLAIGVAGLGIRPHPARAFLWGVASGAGFALAENLFSGAAGGVESWAIGAVARFGTTAMHCLASGLVGWGWGQLWTQRRPLRLLGSFAAAMAVHGLWNATAVGAGFLGIYAMAHGDPSEAVLAAVGIAALLLFLVAMTVGSIIALIVIGKRLAGQVEQAPEIEGVPEEVLASPGDLAL